MLKKTVTFEDFSDPPQKVTEDFYFNFTKLELMETDLELGGVEALIEELTKTEDVKKAYAVFKQLILGAYGEKSADGRTFTKVDDQGRALSRRFEASPALSEIIIEFLNDPAAGAKFIEGVLPASLVAEVKAAEEARKTSNAQVTEMVQVAAERQENPETAVLATAPPVLEESKTEWTRDQLLALSDEAFDAAVGTDFAKMTAEQQQIAYIRKTRK